MWKCPRCQREFANTNQDHYCENAQTIDEYINRQSPEIQPLIRAISETIRVAAPEAEEKISWRMPTFWQRKNIIHFAAFKKHIGIYPGDEAIVEFAERLSENKTSKGSIQLPLDKPIDHELISDIVRWRIEKENPEK